MIIIMKRIKLLFSFLALVIFEVTFAQEYSNQSLYNRNQLLINPAASGYTDGLNVSTGFRKQWLGIDGAPQTLSFSGHGFASAYNVGAGILVQQYTLGAFKQTAFFTTYAYRLKFEFGTLHLGLQAGLINNQSNLSQEDLLGIIDPSFVAQDFSETKFNVGTGAFFFSEAYYVGISAPLILNKNYEVGESGMIETNRPIFLTSGYLYHYNPNFIFKPYVYARYLNGAPFGYDLGLTAYYQEYFGLGFLYKSENTISFNMELIFNRSIYVSYAYDLPGGEELSQVEHGSHEFIINYVIPWKKDTERIIRFF